MAGSGAQASIGRKPGPWGKPGKAFVPWTAALEGAWGKEGFDAFERSEFPGGLEPLGVFNGSGCSWWFRLCNPRECGCFRGGRPLCGSPRLFFRFEGLAMEDNPGEGFGGLFSMKFGGNPPPTSASPARSPNSASCCAIRNSRATPTTPGSSSAPSPQRARTPKAIGPNSSAPSKRRRPSAYSIFRNTGISSNYHDRGS